jgi:hypothetical protein
MELDGVVTDTEPTRNVMVSSTRHYEFEYLSFAPRKLHRVGEWLGYNRRIKW